MRLVRYSYPSNRLFASSSGFQSPWSGLESEINRLFESTVGELAAPTADRFPVDLYEDKENYYVRAELPGVDRANINVEMVEDYLNLAASRKNTNPDGTEGEAFSLSRSIEIAESVQADKVAAQYQDGVLTVTLPKREEAKPRKIAVSVN